MKHKQKILFRFFRFSVVGFINTALHIGIFYLLYVSLNGHYLVGQSVAFLVVTLLTFLMNKYWTFENRSRNIKSQLALYYLFRSVSLLLTLFQTWLLVRYYGVSPLTCQFAAILINVTVNFALNHIFVFIPPLRPLQRYLEESEQKLAQLAPEQQVTLYFVVPLFKEHKRLFPKSKENPHGEDFLRVKIAQLEELQQWNPKFFWKLILVDDGDFTYQSGLLAQVYLEGNYPGLLQSGKVAVWFLHEMNPSIAQSSQKGGAVVSAFRCIANNGMAPDDILLYTDADVSSDLRLTGSLIAPLFNGYDISISSRWHEQSSVVNRGFKQKFSSWVYNLVVSVLLWIDYSDTQNGFKAFTASSACHIVPYLREISFAFDTEMLMVAEVLGKKVHEVPIYWQDSREETNVNLLRDPLKMVFKIYKQSRYRRKLLKTLSR